MRSFAQDPDFFSSQCGSLLERMLNTVPKTVQLSEIIEPLPVKPFELVLSLASNGSLVMSGYIRVRIFLWVSFPYFDQKIVLRYLGRLQSLLPHHQPICLSRTLCFLRRIITLIFQHNTGSAGRTGAVKQMRLTPLLRGPYHRPAQASGAAFTFSKSTQLLMPLSGSPRLLSTGRIPPKFLLPTPITVELDFRSKM